MKLLHKAARKSFRRDINNFPFQKLDIEVIIQLQCVVSPDRENR